jgi:transmembrane sensor
MSQGGDRFSGRQRDADTRDAADWFARWQAGTIDEPAFDRWRDADPAHALAFARVTAAWEAADTVATPALPAQPNRRHLMRGGAAGAILVAAGTTLFASRAYAWDSASTRVGETRRIRLPDNSVAVLNTDTALSWRFSSTRRELWLDHGEVAIDLQPGPVGKLSTSEHVASLQPGRFNARLRNTALDLIVFRGSASAGAPDAAAAAGNPQAKTYQHLSFAGPTPAVVPISADGVDAALAWQSGDIVFVDTPLADAVAEYNRYLPRKIVIDDAAVGSIRVGGRFLSSDPSDFLHATAASLGVRVRSDAGGFHLSK